MSLSKEYDLLILHAQGQIRLVGCQFLGYFCLMVNFGSITFVYLIFGMFRGVQSIFSKSIMPEAKVVSNADFKQELILAGIKAVVTLGAGYICYRLLSNLLDPHYKENQLARKRVFSSAGN
jgi:hypothetical protein